jgi:hypothetical protein
VDVVVVDIRVEFLDVVVVEIAVSTIVDLLEDWMK